MTIVDIIIAGLFWGLITFAAALPFLDGLILDKRSVLYPGELSPERFDEWLGHEMLLIRVREYARIAIAAMVGGLTWIGYVLYFAP